MVPPVVMKAAGNADPVFEDVVTFSKYGLFPVYCQTITFLSHMHQLTRKFWDRLSCQHKQNLWQLKRTEDKNHCFSTEKEAWNTLHKPLFIIHFHNYNLSIC